MNRLRQKYENEVKNQMVEKFGYKSVIIFAALANVSGCAPNS